MKEALENLNASLEIQKKVRAQILQHTATNLNKLQQTAAQRNTLQHTSVCLI